MSKHPVNQQIIQDFFELIQFHLERAQNARQSLQQLLEGPPEDDNLLPAGTFQRTKTAQVPRKAAPIAEAEQSQPKKRFSAATRRKMSERMKAQWAKTRTAAKRAGMAPPSKIEKMMPRKTAGRKPATRAKTRAAAAA